MLRILLAGALSVLMASSAFAQNAPGGKQTAAKQTEKQGGKKAAADKAANDKAAEPPAGPPLPAQDAVAAPYDPDLLKLVEVLGSISYLAGACPGNGVEPAQEWRSKAQALIDAEAPTGPRREKLLGFYNRGFGSYSMIHRRCTQSARVLVTRLLGEAAQLSRIIGARFGG